MALKEVFVTGGSGFIGRRLIHLLVERGVAVRALARSDRAAVQVESTGASVVRGDVHDLEALWTGMRGCDAVFHLAAEYDLDENDWRKTEKTNVEGTRNVLSLAYECGVSRIVYAGALSMFGDTRGELIDETFPPAGRFANHFERTKWLGYHDVVLPLIEQGAPIIVAHPGEVFGPGDTGFIGQLVERFYFHRLPFPFLPAPNTVFTFAYVDDVATGLILLAERGRLGESYFLAGPAVSLGEIVDFWARLTGKRPPTFHVPASFVRPILPLLRMAGRIVHLPSLFGAGTVAMLGSTYMASSAKVQEELGWQVRPIQVGFLETFGAMAAEVAENPRPIGREREIATVALGTAALLLVFWLFNRFRPR